MGLFQDFWGMAHTDVNTDVRANPGPFRRVKGVSWSL